MGRATSNRATSLNRGGPRHRDYQAAGPLKQCGRLPVHTASKQTHKHTHKPIKQTKHTQKKHTHAHTSSTNELSTTVDERILIHERMRIRMDVSSDRP